MSSNTHPKIVVTRNLGPDVMPLLQNRSDIEIVVWPEDRACDRKWLLENAPGSTGIILMLSDKVNDELLDAAGPNLRVVSTMSVGYEHVDLAAVSARGIKVGYTPDVLTDAVADICIMLALMAGRNAGDCVNIVQRGEWPKSPWGPFSFCGPQLSATPTNPIRKAGFLGFGRISQATLARLIPFGVTHCLYTSNPASPPNLARDAALLSKHGLQEVKRVDADTLASESDILFVLAPGGETTNHSVNEAFLKKMKKTSVIVNAGRGTLVDSNALAKALREGWIWGAGLDVVDGEPGITTEHPLVQEPRCVILPHIGSATLETRLGMATLAAKNALAGVFGEAMPAAVDFSRLK